MMPAIEKLAGSRGRESFQSLRMDFFWNRRPFWQKERASIVNAAHSAPKPTIATSSSSLKLPLRLHLLILCCAPDRTGWNHLKAPWSLHSCHHIRHRHSLFRSNKTTLRESFPSRVTPLHKHSSWCYLKKVSLSIYQSPIQSSHRSLELSYCIGKISLTQLLFLTWLPLSSITPTLTKWSICLFSLEPSLFLIMLLAVRSFYIF